MTIPDFLQPGDYLAYHGTGFVAWVISVKTWHDVTHCEVYVGAGETVASRGPQDGVGGVGRYALRLDDLVHVLRPLMPFDLARALRWFETVNGEQYDLWGLLRFFSVGAGRTDRMFCSEFATRFYRAGGVEPFQPDEDADAVAPCQFLISPIFAHYRINRGLVTPAHFVG